MKPAGISGESGVTAGPLLIAAVLASPALWRSVSQHQLPLYVALERLLVIAVLCVVVADVVRRYFDVVPTPQAAAEPVATVSPAAAPTPIEQDWGSGGDLFALDPLPGEERGPLA